MKYKLESPFLSAIPDEHSEKLSRPHVLIVGLGESGFAMAKWCLLQGAQVRLVDTRQQEHLNAKQHDWLSELKKLGLKEVVFEVTN